MLCHPPQSSSCISRGDVGRQPTPTLRLLHLQRRCWKATNSDSPSLASPEEVLEGNQLRLSVSCISRGVGRQPTPTLRLYTSALGAHTHLCSPPMHGHSCHVTSFLSELFHSQEFSVCLEKGPRVNKLQGICVLMLTHIMLLN